MNEKDRAIMKASLIKLFAKWLKSDELDRVMFPYLGDDIESVWADSIIVTIRAMAGTEKYIKEDARDIE